MVSIVSLGRFTPGDYKERRRGQSDAAHNLAAGKRRQGCSTVLQLTAKDSLLQTIDKNSENKFDRRGLMFSRALQERPNSGSQRLMRACRGSAPREPHLNSDKTYVVMDAPIGMLDTLLNVLRNEKLSASAIQKSEMVRQLLFWNQPARLL
jgi:hypothetical protein